MLSVKCASQFKLLGLLMSKMMWEICPEWGRRSGLRWPNEGKYTAKWGVQMAGMIFKTRSGSLYMIARMAYRHQIIKRNSHDRILFLVKKMIQITHSSVTCRINKIPVAVWTDFHFQLIRKFFSYIGTSMIILILNYESFIPVWHFRHILSVILYDFT